MELRTIRTLYEKKEKMRRCKNCNCDCHCDGDLHTDVYGVCTCDNCKCREVKDKSEGLVVDDTDECESCQ